MDALAARGPAPGDGPDRRSLVGRRRPGERLGRRRELRLEKARARRRRRRRRRTRRQFSLEFEIGLELCRAFASARGARQVRPDAPRRQDLRHRLARHGDLSGRDQLHGLRVRPHHARRHRARVQAPRVDLSGPRHHRVEDAHAGHQRRAPALRLQVGDDQGGRRGADPLLARAGLGGRRRDDRPGREVGAPARRGATATSAAALSRGSPRVVQPLRASGRDLARSVPLGRRFLPPTAST